MENLILNTKEKQWKKLPIFIKAIELENIIAHIVKAVEKTDINFNTNIEAEMIQHNLDYLQKNAMTIPAKIAGVANHEILYDLRMKNAALIRKAAREIITDARGLEMHGYKDKEYLDLLGHTVYEFRVLFAKWVKIFDPWNYIIDRRGLFNLPGINYDDHDPDYDISF